jgi:alkylation response protein AidB-like acyl-CoA dehydrogenase
MQIDASTSIDKFRTQVRDWIGDNAPPGLAEMTDWSPLLHGFFACKAERATDEYAQWVQRMLDEHLVCAHWPTRYGGRDLTPEQARVVDEECLRANVPRVFRELGEAIVGDTVLAYGTEQQKAYFIPRIIDGSHKYSQGFSEPNHGSDLASIDTRGVVDGDELIINGEKTWTTEGQDATMLFVMCRTDPTAENKYRGLSFVLVDVLDNRENIEFRPIKQLTGEAEFCQTFFDDARAPVGNIIGGLNNGWTVAMTTLENERSGRAAQSRKAIRSKDFADLVGLLRSADQTGNQEVRQRLAKEYAVLQALDWWSRPGKPGVHQSVQKLVSASWNQRMGELALEISGESAMIRPDGADYPLTSWQARYLGSLSGTIAGGSNEVQRNVISERILRLPREYRRT